MTRDERTLTAAELPTRPHAERVTLAELLPFLASPDSSRTLSIAENADALTDGNTLYPLRSGCPLLLPARLHAYFADRLNVPYALDHDAFLQYFLLASIKQSGEINAASDNLHYRRHLFRLEELCRSASGLVLDIGCDDPILSAALLPHGARYIGLDPFCQRASPFRLIGLGEYLPFRSGAVDGVLFNTSLDHILDYRRAIDEAHRALTSGGFLYLSTLAWSDRAELTRDSVHFHHFREDDIFSALAEFETASVTRYDYKGDSHRHGLYIRARKRKGSPTGLPTHIGEYGH